MKIESEGNPLQVALLLCSEKGWTLAIPIRVLGFECGLLEPWFFQSIGRKGIIQVVVFIAHVLWLKSFLAPQIVQEKLVLASELNARSFAANLSILLRPFLL